MTSNAVPVPAPWTVMAPPPPAPCRRRARLELPLRRSASWSAGIAASCAAAEPKRHSDRIGATPTANRCACRPWKHRVMQTAERRPTVLGSSADSAPQQVSDPRGMTSHLSHVLLDHHRH